MPDTLHVTRWWSAQPDVTGYWGPSTSSIDWCEANYAISRFIAEFTNTVSNLFFVTLALYGVKKCRDEALPFSLALCQIGALLVGIGSSAFHATLKYDWQLADELPMIYTSSFIAYVAFDTCRAGTPRPWFIKLLPFFLFFYDMFVTIVYLRHPNPVFHQLAYAFLQISFTIVMYFTLRDGLYTTPQEKRNRADVIQCVVRGSTIFLGGFLIWNIDNIFCDQISQIKQAIGTPLSFILEGHAWWHLATGTGAYLIIVGVQLLSCTLREGAEGFELKMGWGGICPYVSRVRSSDKSKKRIS
ncbi:hypothetical protein CROQUDRAFT_650577 [Cronartium quercuum f. sp. fusiforme G11]|uniref:Alkaline phytoceramidase n=1 Tax=Cronartium quercuum f. sp. fusiforme G11 TaxID=708437 RepID=A0A9P6NYU6_9BASI|nr:hypothetical protein CROQUDRAFT_650577 [Cronartium quercuum f. sp. fusiforme G11]